ncbi:MAG: ribosome small subunit-dependent GTPase A [Caldicoprobacterales bacterium]|jgi:ribosome biogenesis GTPase|nr:ribosome small subunit-dependent GTPase A [Clostridiales bacterium]
MKQGIITKGVGGFYDVLVDNYVVRCRARGVFRKDNIIPMVGDKVMISTKDKAIIEILPRKNQLLRPTVANIDLLGIVLAPTHPVPDFYLIDKLMINAEINEIKVMLIINKIDLVENKEIKDIIDIYKPTQYPIVTLSCREQMGFEKLHDFIKDNVVTLAGQSGVGKSSIINVLYPEKVLETGQLSEKIHRGRHTTRHSRLLVLPSGGMIVDTPGFSTMNMNEVMPEDLSYLYPDFIDYIHQCRFNGCMHDKEPGCMIKEAVAEGSISQGRYDRYIRILNELREFRRNIW